MKKQLLTLAFIIPIAIGAQNLWTNVESLTVGSLPQSGWDTSTPAEVTVASDGTYTYINMPAAATQRSVRNTHNFVANVSYRLSFDIRVSEVGAPGESINPAANFRQNGYSGAGSPLVQIAIPDSNNENATITNSQNLNAIQDNFSTTEFVTFYGSFSSPNTETLYMNIFRNNNTAAGKLSETFQFNNITLKVLDCKPELIEMLDNGTSIATIYDNDINNGNAINIGVNENVSAVTFYEADGVTNANSKFTLNTNGTITSVSGTTGSDYMIEYTLTSTSDADGVNGNDADTIKQTFSVVASLSTNELKVTDFSYFLNRKSNNLELSSKKQVDSLRLYNLMGQEVLNEKVNSKNSKINVNNISKGIYIMNVNFEDNLKGSYKIVIR